MAEHSALARLGFGCSVLGGGLSERAQRALLDAALEAGVRHFDVAPSYGHGEAELVLGRALAGGPAGVTVATKAGIAHPVSPAHLAMARRWLVPLKQLAPGIWQHGARRVRQATAARGQFAPVEVLATVHESLRRLQRSHIDHLLLHEVRPSDVQPALLAALQGLLAQGLVGALGLGTTVAHSVAIVANYPGSFARVQTSHYWGAFTPALTASGATLLTHRCLRAGLTLANDPELRASVQIHPQGVSLSRLLLDGRALPELLVTAGLQATGAGILLLSSSKPARVREMARWVLAPRYQDEARVLNECLRQLARPGTTAAQQDG